MRGNEVNLTCAGETITGVSSITGAVEAARFIDTGSMFTASSVVLGAFINIFTAYYSFSKMQQQSTADSLTN